MHQNVAKCHQNVTKITPKLSSIPLQDVLRKDAPHSVIGFAATKMGCTPPQDLQRKIGQNSVTGLAAKNWAAFRHSISCEQLG